MITVWICCMQNILAGNDGERVKLVSKKTVISKKQKTDFFGSQKSHEDYPNRSNSSSL